MAVTLRLNRATGQIQTATQIWTAQAEPTTRHRTASLARWGNDSYASSCSARVSGNGTLEWNIAKSAWVGVYTDLKGEQHTVVKAVSRMDSLGVCRHPEEFATLKAKAKEEVTERMAKFS